MRNIYSLTFMATIFIGFTACSDSSTDRSGYGPVQTINYNKLEEFEDYSPVFASNGQKAVFLSTRSSDLPLAYFYDASADSKVVRLDDRLSLDATDGKESLATINADGTLVALSRVNLNEGTQELIVSQTSGLLKANRVLPEGTSLDELHFARGSSSYLATVERSAGVRTLKVFKVESDDSAVTLSEIGSFVDQADMRFTLVEGVLTLVSFGPANASLEKAMTIRTFDETQATWSTVEGQFTGKVSSLDRTFAVSDAGLFTLERLATPKIRNKTGTGPTVGQDIAGEKVSISDSVTQTDIFANTLPFDFSASSYLATEPLGISAISTTMDGDYLLASGIDAFTCVMSSQQFPVMKLVRRTDMKVVNILVARKIGTLPWTDLVTNACAIFEDGSSREYDTTIGKAELLGQDGEFFLIAVHSFARGDEEIRLVRFKVDFDNGIASEVSIADVSANAR